MHITLIWWDMQNAIMSASVLLRFHFNLSNRSNSVCNHASSSKCCFELNALFSMLTSSQLIFADTYEVLYLLCSLYLLVKNKK